jgi:hypothetical protein
MKKIHIRELLSSGRRERMPDSSTAYNKSSNNLFKSISNRVAKRGLLSKFGDLDGNLLSNSLANPSSKIADTVSRLSQSPTMSIARGSPKLQFSAHVNDFPLPGSGFARVPTPLTSCFRAFPFPCAVCSWAFRSLTLSTSPQWLGP